MTSNEWHKMRRLLCHDRLGNRIMPALAKSINILDGNVIDSVFQKNFIHFLTMEYNALSAEVSRLLSTVEIALSPKSHFLSARFDRIDQETVSIVKSEVQKLWSRHFNVQALVEDTQCLMKTCDHTLTKIRNQQISCDNDNMTRISRCDRKLLLLLQRQLCGLNDSLQKLTSLNPLLPIS